MGSDASLRIPRLTARVLNERMSALIQSAWKENIAAHDAPNCRCFSPGGTTGPTTSLSPTATPTEFPSPTPSETSAPSSECDCEKIVIEQEYSIAETWLKNLPFDLLGVKRMCEKGRLEVKTVISSRNCACRSDTCRGKKNVDIMAKYTYHEKNHVQNRPVHAVIDCEDGTHSVSPQIKIPMYTIFDIEVVLKEISPCTLRKMSSSQQVSIPVRLDSEKWKQELATDALDELRVIEKSATSTINTYDRLRLIDANNPAWPKCPPPGEIIIP